MSAISLKPITRENWRECARLTLADDQRDFVAPNVYSLLQYLCQDPTDTFVPLGIYDGETVVGFAMYGMGEFGRLTGWEIWRLIIDKNHQHKGCGRQALHLLIDLLREKFNPDAIYMRGGHHAWARDWETPPSLRDTSPAPQGRCAASRGGLAAPWLCALPVDGRCPAVGTHVATAGEA